jgi:hypothetical protein
MHDRSDNAPAARTMFLKCIFMTMMCPLAFAAEDPPRTPCGTAPNPPYAQPGAQPNVKVWNGGSRGVRVSARCNDSTEDFKVVIGLAGTLRFEGTADQLLARIGAASEMQGIRYWSVTDKQWRVLVTHSAAVQSATSAERRSDFSAAEMKQGRDLFFAQRDSRSTGEVVNRMRMLEATPDRLVIESENVSPIKTFVFTWFRPSELRTVHFLTRHSAGVWNYYALTAVDTKQSDSHMPSLINRAAALYRYVAGQPTDQEPPLAP